MTQQRSSRSGTRAIVRLSRCCLRSPSSGRHVETALAVDGASGAVALEDGRVLGYLVGAPSGTDRVEVGFAGHAAADPEVARDLYATLAQGWVDSGRHRHAVYVPACEGHLVDAWFRLAFGLQFGFAVREVEPAAPMPGDVVIRAGRPDDLDAAAALERSLWEHQVLAPSFSGLDIPSLDVFRDYWADTWSSLSSPISSPSATRRSWGMRSCTCARPATSASRIPSIDLAHVEVVTEQRGTGVGRALFAHVMHWADDEGYGAMTTDWRSVNLLASRFWTARGLRPTYHRLARSIPRSPTGSPEPRPRPRRCVTSRSRIRRRALPPGGAPWFRLLQDRRHLRVGSEVLPARRIPVEDHPHPVLVVGVTKHRRALRAVLRTLLGALRRKGLLETGEVLDFRCRQDHRLLLRSGCRRPQPP